MESIREMKKRSTYIDRKSKLHPVDRFRKELEWAIIRLRMRIQLVQPQYKSNNALSILRTFCSPARFAKTRSQAQMIEQLKGRILSNLVTSNHVGFVLLIASLVCSMIRNVKKELLQNWQRFNAASTSSTSSALACLHPQIALLHHVLLAWWILSLACF